MIERWARAGGVALVAVLCAVALVWVLLRDVDEGPASAAPPAPSPSRPPPIRPPAVLVVKVDNVAAARPQTGLSVADVVYVEPVEGGLTRLAAVFSGRRPAVVGPVRSARESDIELLAQYGAPTLADSGAAGALLPLLRSAPLVNVSPAQAAGAFFRDGARPAPHNLYVRPDRLPAAAAPPPQPVLAFGAAPAGGAPSRQYSVGYRAARFDFGWDPVSELWRVAMDGAPVVSTEAGPVGAATVVVQRVATHAGRNITDSTGAPSPVVRSVGSGPVTVLRDGLAFEGTWSRPNPQAPTMFTGPDGSQLRFGIGQVWILLVPR